MTPEEASRVLGTAAWPTDAAARAAFRRRAAECHPDHGGSSEDFERLLEARQVLRDPQSSFRARPEPPSARPRRFVRRRPRWNAVLDHLTPWST